MTQCHGHFMIYLETQNCEKFDHQRNLFHVRKCSVYVNWWFSSKAEMKRHRRIMHPRILINKLLINQRNMNHNQPDAKFHICHHNNCGQSFMTYHKLLVHKSCRKQGKQKKGSEKKKLREKNPDEFLQQKSGYRGGNPKRRRT